MFGGRAFFTPPPPPPPHSTVPSRRRAAAVEAYGEAATTDAMLEDGDDDAGWVAPPPDAATRGDAAPLLDEEEEGAPPEPVAPEAPAAAAAAEDDDDLPGLDDLQIVGPDDWAETNDAATLPPSSSSALVATRTYDLKITYDKYYQVPRFWLSGYDEARLPLPPAAVLDDVSEEHARKTVTVDAWPHGSGRAASIHPCRHAAVMKKLADVAASGGGGDGSARVDAASVDRYLITFLKFIASVIPTIEYDFTMAA